MTLEGEKKVALQTEGVVWPSRLQIKGRGFGGTGTRVEVAVLTPSVSIAASILAPAAL